MISQFIDVQGLKARLIVFEDDVASASQAARRLNVPIEQIVKSMVFVDENDEPLLALLPGNARVDLNKLLSVTGVQKLKLASSFQVREMTGYEIGGVPPISIYKIRTVCDPAVLTHEKVFCGGGDAKTILEISPLEIESSVEDFQVVDISVKTP